MIQNLLFTDSLPINEKITLQIPTVGDIVDCENEYYPDPEKVAHITGLPLGIVFDLLIELKNQGCLGKR